jgi:hypothetical protein
MRLRRTLALVGAVTAATFAACKEPPFAPRWDADMYMPLSTQPIHLNQFFTLGVIPPAASGSVSFPAQQQSISGVLGTVLTNLVTDPGRARTVLTLTVAKTTPISATDTLFVASDSLGLTNSSAGRIVFPVTIATTDLSKTDSLTLTLAQIGMLQNQPKVKINCSIVGCETAPLWIQLRGLVRNPAASAITITSADSLGITLGVTARIAVSHK